MSMTISRIQKEKQTRERVRKSLSVTVKYEPLNERAMLQFNAGFHDRLSTDTDPIIREIPFYHDKEFWDEREIYEKTMFMARSAAASVPGIEMNGDYSSIINNGLKSLGHFYSLKGKSGLHTAVTIQEGKDFKISIEAVTAYEYENDEPFDWNDIQPINQ